MEDSAASPSDVADHLERTPGVDIVSQQEPNILIEGDASTIDSAVGRFPGWRTFPMRAIPVPTTRPSVLKPPASKK